MGRIVFVFVIVVTDNNIITIKLKITTTTILWIFFNPGTRVYTQKRPNKSIY
jgi:hypothetical protein